MDSHFWKSVWGGIGLLLITIGVPSIVSVLGEQRLKGSFESFDLFVQSIKMKSTSERFSGNVEVVVRKAAGAQGTGILGTSTPKILSWQE